MVKELLKRYLLVHCRFQLNVFIEAIQLDPLGLVIRPLAVGIGLEEFHSQRIRRIGRNGRHFVCDRKLPSEMLI